MSQEKFEELKGLILGEELRRFDTKFMEFGDKLRHLSEQKGAGAGDIDKVKLYMEEQIGHMEEKLNKMQRDVKAGFEKIIETVNAQFQRLNADLQKNASDVESIRNKFSGFQKLFSDK